MTKHGENAIPISATYFECPEGEPSIFDLLIALNGVCESLHAEQISYTDHNQLDRISCMSTAAHLLASQLRNRFYGNRKPAIRRQIEVRRAQAQFQAEQASFVTPAEG